MTLSASVISCKDSYNLWKCYLRITVLLWRTHPRTGKRRRYKARSRVLKAAWRFYASPHGIRTHSLLEHCHNPQAESSNKLQWPAFLFGILYIGMIDEIIVPFLAGQLQVQPSCFKSQPSDHVAGLWWPVPILKLWRNQFEIGYQE